MLKRTLQTLLLTMLLWTTPGLTDVLSPARAGDKVVAGFIEKVSIGEGKLIFKAKLDTGARHSSLNASDIRTFRREKVTWVSFVIKDSTGKIRRLEKKVARVAEVKNRDETFEKRPVIFLPVCLGPVQKEAEINLVDRSFFNYQVLIGRSYLKGNFLVDVDAKYLLDPGLCREGVE